MANFKTRLLPRPALWAAGRDGRSRWSLAMTALAISTLPSCATVYNPATGRTETVLNSSTEIALGNLAKAQMGLVSLRMGRVEAETFQRVHRIGERLARVSDRQDVPYRFGVIQDKDWNAFALPGGTVYVHTGLVETATDDELGAVLAHEVGHVAARHAAKHLQADLGFSVLLQLARATGIGAESARVVDSLYGLFRNGYSRRDELEADRLGIRYASLAGFDPEGMAMFLQKMLEKHPEGPMEEASVWQRTHPLTSERIDKAKQEVARLREEKFCPACGRTYGADKKFCIRDGTPLKERRAK